MAKDKNLTFSTADLKLAALILSEIPNCTFDVKEQGNSALKTILISLPAIYEQNLTAVQEDYTLKRAKINLFLYNRSLNVLRDRLKNEKKWKDGIYGNCPKSA
jgi:lipoate synthase